jgi:hypothetical protein
MIMINLYDVKGLPNMEKLMRHTYLYHGDVGAAEVDHLEHELLAGEEMVHHELAVAERH